MDNSDTTSNLLDDDILDWNTIAIIDSAASSYGSGFQASLPIPSQLDDEVASLKSNRSDGSLVDPQVLPPELANNGDTRAFRENASPAFIDSEASLIPKGEAHEPRVTSILDAQLYQGGQPCPPNLQNKVRYGDPACSSQVLDVAKMVSTCVKSEMLSQHFPSTRASSNSQESLTRTDSAAGSTISSNASEGQQLSSVPPLQKRSFTASNAESQGTSKRRKVFSTEAVERRLTNIHIGLQQREEDDFQRPIVVQCLFDDVPGRRLLPLSINELQYARSVEESIAFSASNPGEIKSVESKNADQKPERETTGVCDRPCPICAPPFAPSTKIDRFLSQFPGFKYKQYVPAGQEFKRLQQFYGRRWSQQRHRQVSEQFRNIMVEQFNDDYGVDENRLQSWQYLCAVLCVWPIPDTVSECREVIRSIYVNLVDLLEYHRSGRPVPTFTTLSQLQHYTKATRKFFPREEAKAGGILKFLLRHIF
ncbi:unnamed protein product [Somion occarium]|uniref:Uncharacterized protein n=1 Tax=Somion occarium TaxID=3059160 RepID=A0ABP1CUR3_9APHY